MKLDLSIKKRWALFKMMKNHARAENLILLAQAGAAVGGSLERQNFVKGIRDHFEIKDKEPKDG